MYNNISNISTKSLLGKFTIAETPVLATAATPTNTDTFTCTIGDQSPIVQLVKTVAFNDVAAKLTIQASLDGENFTTISTVDADVTHTVGTLVYYPDLNGKEAPYYRFQFNGDSLAAGTAGRFKIVFAYRHKA